MRLLFCLLLVAGLFPALNSVFNGTQDFVHLNTASPDPFLEVKSMNIAVIAAGAVRSFAYNERSWRRYIIEPWKFSNIHVFAHVFASKEGCELYEKGIEAMRGLATELEVSHTHSPLLPPDVIKSKFAHVKSCLSHKKSDKIVAGNIIDMHARRNRAYEMAMNYSRVHGFDWHIIMHVRMDSAFYYPRLEFYKIYQGLLNHTAVTGRNAIIIPPGCSFGHVCDRSAIGLAKDMAVYFNSTFLGAVAEWAHSQNDDDSPSFQEDKKWVRDIYECSGERMLKIWLESINHFEITDTSPPALSFITQRCLTANDYCNWSREDFKRRGGRWGDRMTIRQIPTGGFDTASDPEERCGPIHTMNATEVCMRPSCECGKKNR